jgi:hypothetical protein
MVVANCKEVKTGYTSTKSSKEGCGGKAPVLQMMMMIIIIIYTVPFTGP